MKWLHILFLITLSNSLLFATIHEDAEDSKTTRWKKLSSLDTDNIFNYYDEDKKSRVIQLQGEGTKSAFKLDGQNLKRGDAKANYWLSWEMKYSEDFVIMIIIGTNRGKDYLLYTPSSENGHRQYGLGRDSMDGQWHTFRRNLQEDLAYYDNRVIVKSICSFVIRGSGNIDNVSTNIENVSKLTPKERVKIGKIKSEKKVQPVQHKKVIKRIKIAEPKVQKAPKIEEMVKKREKDSLPTIEIFGDNPLHLNLGEEYVEQGVSAKDNEDGNINVVSTEDIDVYKSGEYLVMYMATDSQGNVALDKRKVYVGNEYANKVKKATTQPVEVASAPVEEDESEEQQIEREEQEIQQELWEEELEKRERELRKMASDEK